MRIHSGALVGLLLMLVLPLSADPCGCSVPVAPCEAATFETVTVPFAPPVHEEGFDMSLAHCWSCDQTNLLGSFVMTLVLLPFLIAVHQMNARRNRLLVPRFDLLGRRMQFVAVETGTPRGFHDREPVTRVPDPRRRCLLDLWRLTPGPLEP
jgi:hypothetical protein